MSVYLDNNATTAISSNVLKATCTALANVYGNPSDLYNIGVIAKREVEESRKKIALLLGADVDNDNSKDKLVFTGCATEANNAVFRSAVKTYPEKRHIIVSCVEHLSVLEVAKDLGKNGYEITYIPVDFDGNLDMKALQESVRKDTLLVSIMLANNETGVLFPIAEIATLVKHLSSETLIHTDAVQAAGKIPIDVKQLGVDFLSISGHKFHAPKGVGALYIKSGVPFYPFLLGGHQETHLRAGTENVASIIAMGEAALAAEKSARNQDSIRQLRDYLEQELRAIPVSSFILGEKTSRLANTTNIAFSNIDGVRIMLNLSTHEIYISTGSACNSSVMEPSHVVVAMGVPPEFQKSIRVSLSDHTNQQEIDQLLQAIRVYLSKETKANGSNN